MTIKSGDLGFFGNVWVRHIVLDKAGDCSEGHKHTYDHVSLLTKGKVKVEVEGHPEKEFTAPTFIIIRKNYEHKVTALEDDSNWYCVFALRDLDGEVIEHYEGKHDPLSAL
jgi:quercetin dioxygenase-like cupin family protein